MSTSNTPQVIQSVEELRQWRRAALLAGKSVGLVPTMGALHEGHLNLVRAARSSCDLVVISIYVNPSQFAPHEDLDVYPRTLPQDVELLSSNGVSSSPLADVVFTPRTIDVYPDGITTDRSKQQGAFVEVLGLSHQMEGVTRPHFFRGVATVVTKLLNLVLPDSVFLGQKDAQQCVVVRSLIRNLCLPVKMVVVPTTRETDGLAMSSRNRYLSKEEREASRIFYAGLSKARDAFNAGERERNALLTLVQNEIEKTAPLVQLEYLSLAHPRTLQELNTIDDAGAILSGAVKLPSARLIDNLLFNCEL
ncbi:Pantoate-beta-alanine ligase [Syncephalis plumigaleata]|nr:Pantoate-beta-alanine ligase [Syncephalis plumigaleata]